MAAHRTEALDARAQLIALVFALAAIAHALALGFAILAVTSEAVAASNAIVAGVAGATLAVVACSALTARRSVALLAGAHALTAAILLSGIAPRVPRVIPFAALVVAAALTALGLVLVRRRAVTPRPPRPLVLPPRVAALALVIQAALQLWVDASPSLAAPLRAAVYLALAVVATSTLASLALVTLQLGRRWLITGLALWTLGWLASTADLPALVLWSLGAPYPIAAHQLRVVAPELLQSASTLGGLAIGAALVTTIRDPRYRHSAGILLVAHAVLGVLAAVGEHRIALATSLPNIVALRGDRDFAAAIRDLALAGVLWIYWRRVVAPDLPTATTWHARA